MNNTLKILLAVIGLLLIGFLAGYQTHRTMVRNKMKRVAKERIAPGFVERLMDILEVREGQVGEVEPVLRDYSKRLIESRRVEMERRRPILDSMRMDLQGLLDNHQAEKLDRVIERMKRTRRHKHKKKGPHSHRKKG